MIVFDTSKKSLKEDRIIKFTKPIDIVPVLKEKKIISVEYSGPEIQFGYESSGLYQFEWGGGTMLFVKGDYFLRIFIKSITGIEQDVPKHCFDINLKPGQYVKIIYER
jgi:hypothetical protein